MCLRLGPVLLSWVVATACQGPSADPAPWGSILVRLELADEVMAAGPDRVVLGWSDGEGGVLRERELRTGGAGTVLGTARIDLSGPGSGMRTVVARAFLGQAALGYASATVDVEEGATVDVVLRLASEVPPDRDGDGLSDALDGCPDHAGRTSPPCEELPPSDAAADGAGGAPPMLLPEPPAPLPEGPDAGGATDLGTATPAKTTRGHACVRDDECDSGHCGQSRQGRFCSSALMVAIPAGSVAQGCDGARDACRPEEVPRHAVELSAFEIDVTEVTQSQYDACVKAKGCNAPRNGWNPGQRPRHPVTHVTWDMARAFCQWAGKRLPTEAEWEKAARGPADAPYQSYPWGDEAPDCARAQFAACGLRDVVPVATLIGPSPYGTQDMAGNAAEWVNDFFDEAYYAKVTAGTRDPRGPAMGRGRVRRGGSFLSDAAGIRASAREGGDAVDLSTTSFRCARSL